MLRVTRTLNLVVLFIYFILPLSASANDRDFVLPVSSNEIKIMSYNVQNLFDAEHDEDKNDYEFLPKANPLKSHCKEAGNYERSCYNLDWTPEKVELKLQQIKRAIAAQGPTPDILVLTEVENPTVVALLVKTLGYSGFRMTDSPDRRGIDCAILFSTAKMQLIKYVEQEVEKAMSPTRNLSAAIFQLNAQLGGGVLAVFANHWPSQASPTKARLAVANRLRSLVKEVKAEFKNKGGFNYILTGDFNTLADESPNPIETVLLSPKWSGGLLDVRQAALADKSVRLPNMPEATYFYAAESAWNEFDRFFVNTELVDGKGLDVELSSYRIHAPSLVTEGHKKSGVEVPFRYNHSSEDTDRLGFSDHFGVVMKLSYK